MSELAREGGRDPWIPGSPFLPLFFPLPHRRLPKCHNGLVVPPLLSVPRMPTPTPLQPSPGHRHVSRSARRRPSSPSLPFLCSLPPSVRFLQWGGRGAASDRPAAAAPVVGTRSVDKRVEERGEAEPAGEEEREGGNWEGRGGKGGRKVVGINYKHYVSEPATQARCRWAEEALRRSGDMCA